MNLRPFFSRFDRFDALECLVQAVIWVGIIAIAAAHVLMY